MPTKNRQPVLLPAFTLRVNNIKLPEAAAANLSNITVQEDVDAPGMFTLRLLNWSIEKRSVIWVDDELFTEGSKLEIGMWLRGEPSLLIVGEITGLEPEFAAGELSMLTVRGYDRRHRLLRGCHTRSFTNMTDSEIVKQVAASCHLDCKPTETSIKLDYVLQHNQSDMEFLQSRARLIGYEIAIDGETLLFRPLQYTQSTALTLAREDLLEFTPRSTTLTQVSEVQVQSWYEKEKTLLLAKASSTPKMGGDTSGPQRTKAAFGESSATIVTQSVFSAAEADRMAQGQFNDMALDYISGEGRCIGRANLRAGVVIEITGIGKRFSGRYYVVSATHTYTPEFGYLTAFRVRRNAT